MIAFLMILWFSVAFGLFIETPYRHPGERYKNFIVPPLWPLVVVLLVAACWLGNRTK
jgi:hypothetical protein